MNAKEREVLPDRLLILFALRVAEDYKGKAIREVLPGVTEHDISRWKRGGENSLSGDKRRDLLRGVKALTHMYDAPDAGSLSDPSTTIQAMDTAALNLPDVSYLHPRARAVFDEAIGSYVRRGWTFETIESAAVALLGYFIGTSTLRSSGVSQPELSEEMQVTVLEKSRREIESVFGRRGGD